MKELPTYYHTKQLERMKSKALEGENLNAGELSFLFELIEQLERGMKEWISLCESQKSENIGVLFEGDLIKIENAVEFHVLGSHQIGEIARISGILGDNGIDVIRVLQDVQRVRGLYGQGSV